MIVQGFVQKDALAASVHSYLRQRQAQQYLKKYIYIYKRLKWFVKQHQVHKTK
jgi:hypothetical protein